MRYIYNQSAFSRMHVLFHGTDQQHGMRTYTSSHALFEVSNHEFRSRRLVLFSASHVMNLRCSNRQQPEPCNEPSRRAAIDTRFTCTAIGLPVLESIPVLRRVRNQQVISIIMQGLTPSCNQPKPVTARNQFADSRGLTGLICLG